MGFPTVYPTGVTIYNPEKSWSGYTIFQAAGEGALLIDMTGKEINLWKGLHGFPNKILPGGYVIGSTGERNPKYGMQDMTDLVQVDWDGNIVWRFNKLEYIEDPGEEPQWMARQHHDYQREGNTVGYYAPDQEPLVDGGNTFILCHENVKNLDISEKLLLDDKIIEVTWDGEIVWSWNANEHFHELGFDEAAKNIIYRDPNMRPAGGGMGDWLHINSMSLLGSNRWYDSGDERFHPDNIIWDSREANIMAIIDKKTGKIVWKLGPTFDNNEELKKIGWIIGQHHVHLIPKGLPGEGNILIFDNGGWAGYGLPNPNSPTGRQNARRDYSRVLEINPITLEIEWQYTPSEAGFVHPVDSYRFYSPFISSAQRLPNGNTLITEGSDGRIFEVTKEHEIVWEYISPYEGDENFKLNMVYRAYRVPYSWIPQIESPTEEVAIEKVDKKFFRVPGAAGIGSHKETIVKGVKDSYKTGDGALCVLSDNDLKID
ncbi:arylsulfotransferase domain-containing protein [Gottschalkia acidurici 9a]|uniref:Arylsulfotransferase domain-containing protein n=1 Tax=Gottschalkia acidurici (strain ATCC 7906 / DSM 604 / BCRC 14475 / CIP 104303 / KCTC 5404 / NCIMB 10678 / 9a) TaxID=1128398 RepID=K0AZJ5_GOTA9|nr:aryl-sulfate sulfotransferase [Gottschalkia acidurici]AFS77791.1 arylsulfotransferase domain-containing protein [Gottschalkia acidurici 9a]